MFSKAFLVDVAERAIKTYLQFFVGGLAAVNWVDALNKTSIVEVWAWAALGPALSVVSSALSNLGGTPTASAAPADVSYTYVDTV